MEGNFYLWIVVEFNWNWLLEMCHVGADEWVEFRWNFFRSTWQCLTTHPSLSTARFNQHLKNDEIFSNFLFNDFYICNANDTPLVSIIRNFSRLSDWFWRFFWRMTSDTPRWVRGLTNDSPDELEWSRKEETRKKFQLDFYSDL